MHATRIVLMPLCFIQVLSLAAGAVELSTTGSNIALGEATVQGDIFASELSYDNLYSGAWAHVYVPSGNGGVNSGDSERTVRGRIDTRTITGKVNECTLTNGYGDTTVIAKASKMGTVGSAEAFSEVSARTWTWCDSISVGGQTGGYSQIVAYVSHSGNGKANASADGSSDHAALMDNCVVGALGSVDGRVALHSANTQGGYVTGAAFKMSYSYASSGGTPYAKSECFDYLSLESSRNSHSGVSSIDGFVTGGASANGFAAQSGNPGKYASSTSSLTGDLSATAATYMLGDRIAPGAMAALPLYRGFTTQLDDQIASRKTGISIPLYWIFIGNAPKASAYIISQSEADYEEPPSPQSSLAQTESFTSAGVTRTLADSREAYGASYINQGSLSTKAYTSSEPGGRPITLASAGVEEIKMGSGAHLVSRLTGAAPASAADLTITSIMIAAADAYGLVKVTGSAHKASDSDPGVEDVLVSVVGPSYSGTGTAADATGSYLTTAKIDGIAVYSAGTSSAAPSTQISKSMSNADIWSWVSGDDSKSHAESSAGTSPVFSSGTITSTGATATSRSIDVIFSTA
ncbi:MAG TPA: hypothetical protein VN455_01225 [Methanotrichaceae archaeon]|nr:hypothetical protein [Methanotrichaceae archaeon]